MVGQPRRAEFQSITLLRGVAALVVVWTHLVGYFCSANGIAWQPLVLTRAYVNEPLQLPGDFGMFGVGIFFVLSGFIISFASQQESVVQFVVKRVLRIYPALIVSLLVIAALLTTYARLTGSQFLHMERVTAAGVARSAMLFNRLFYPHENMNPVAWSLVLEVLFYTLTALLLPLLKRWPTVALAGQWAAYSAAVRWLSGSATAEWRMLAVQFSCLFPLLLGQLVYFAWAGRIRAAVFAGLSVAYYIEYVHALRTVHKPFYTGTPNCLLSLILPYLLVVLLILLDERIRVPRLARFFSTISYSLYLNHNIVGLMVLTVIVPWVGYLLGLLLTMAVVVGLSTLSYRFVELPAQRAARYILAVRRPAAPAASDTRPKAAA